MIDARQICPVCKNISLGITRSVLVGTPSTAKCPACDWEGPLEDAATFVSREKLYGIEELSVHLMNVTAASTAGPLVVAMERVGLLPPKATVASVGWHGNDLQRYNALVDDARGEVIRAVVAASIQAALEAAGEAAEKIKAFKPEGRH